MAKKKRRRYTKLRLKEISGVDNPAQEPAVAVALFKRLDAPRNEPGHTAKGYVADEPALTTAEAGHQHTIDLSTASGYTSWETGSGIVQPDGSSQGHSHPYVIADGGVVVIGEAAGHTHDGVAAVAAKDAGNGNDPNGESMPTKATGDAGADQNAERIAELEEQATKRDADLKRQTALAGLTDAEKEHLGTLEGDEADAFLFAEAGKRAAAIESAKAADKVVYTSKSTGDVYRASDDPRLVAMAKREDAREERLANAEKAQAEAGYKVRVGKELAHLPGKEEDQIALLKAIDTIEDVEQRGRVLSIVHANDAGVGNVHKRAGANGEPEVSAGEQSDAEKRLNKLATDHAAEKGIPFTKAYYEVTQTPEGTKLLEQAIGTTTPATAS